MVQMVQETRLATPLVRWAPFPAADMMTGDVRFEVGDCLFACVSYWLNVSLGRTLFFAQRLRQCISEALTWPETAPYLETILLELQVTSDLSEALTLEAAQRLVLQRDCWGCNGLMLVLSFVCSKLLHRRVGFVIVELTLQGIVRQPIHCVPTAYDLGCVLHYDIANEQSRDNSHYRIVASRRGAVLFDKANERWITRLTDLDAPPAEPSEQAEEEEDEPPPARRPNSRTTSDEERDLEFGRSDSEPDEEASEEVRRAADGCDEADEWQMAFLDSDGGAFSSALRL